jgi:glucose/arabinose dehydrogenase
VATYAPGAIDLALSSVVAGLSSPLFVTNAGDGSGRLFVVEKAGKIKIVSGGVVTGTFLDIRAKVSKDGERGLLGLAFHPDYPTTGTFYVYYTDLNGKIALAVYRRSTGDPDKADPVGSVLLRISKPYSNHNGGMLAFGPDGYLYMGTGDGGSGGDPGNPRPEPEVAPREDAPDRHQRADLGWRTRSRARTRTSARSATTRSGRAASGTRGGSRSTPSPVTCGSAMSARTAGRRSTGHRPPAAAVRPRTTGGG